ncbi:MAG TPA: redoxin domain-containing protein [Terriglobales bacterium]|nr:redoxin domain-containing protein [Terriglobales bacterium]
MQALTRGTFAPDFRLPNVGGGDLSLADVLRRGPVVLAFFKVSCPVCQLALPYVERLHAASAGAASVIGISQNDEKLTRVFMSEYGLSLPVLLDDPRSYPSLECVPIDQRSNFVLHRAG